jgi:hypothetical protein
VGTFLSLSGIIGSDQDAVMEALSAYAERSGHSLWRAELMTDDEGCLVSAQSRSGVTVLYPNGVPGTAESQFLSERLGAPVFWFHIHDGDFWMYSLFERGVVVDQFNPVPDDWESDEDAELEAWAGNAHEVAKRITGLVPEAISNYLVPWDESLVQDGSRKAYATDRFCYGDDWQLVDFMDKIGFAYPVDDHGTIIGATYKLSRRP